MEQASPEPRITVVRLERIERGMLRAYASVRVRWRVEELKQDWALMELRWLRILENEAGDLYVRHPSYKTDDGEWVPVYWVPNDLRCEINAAVLAAYETRF